MSPRTTTRLVAALGLACTLLTAACSDDFSPTEPNWAPALSKHESTGGKSTLDRGPKSTDAWSEDGTDEEGDKLIKSDLGWRNGMVTAVIDERGGTLLLFSTNDEDLQAPHHSLVVPPGAVSGPTHFAMELGATSAIDVHLMAATVGSKTTVTAFDVPLTLTLTYEGSAGGATDYVIAHLVNGDISEIVASSVDRSRKVVVGQIWHFSRYAVAYE